MVVILQLSHEFLRHFRCFVGVPSPVVTAFQVSESISKNHSEAAKLRAKTCLLGDVGDVCLFFVVFCFFLAFVCFVGLLLCDVFCFFERFDFGILLMFAFLSSTFLYWWLLVVLLVMCFVFFE